MAANDRKGQVRCERVERSYRPSILIWRTTATVLWTGRTAQRRAFPVYFVPIDSSSLECAASWRRFPARPAALAVDIERLKILTAAGKRVSALRFRSMGRKSDARTWSPEDGRRPVRPRSRGGFQHRTDAERFLKEFQERLTKFGLDVHPDKTRLIAFGREARRNRKRVGRETGIPQTSSQGGELTARRVANSVPRPF